MSTHEQYCILLHLETNWHNSALCTWEM